MFLVLKDLVIAIRVGGKPMVIAVVDLTVYDVEVFTLKFVDGSCGIASPVHCGLREWYGTDNSAEGGTGKNSEGGETHGDDL